MCSYKLVKVYFEVWGLQGKVESGVHKVMHTHTHTTNNTYIHTYMCDEHKAIGSVSLLI